jgi:hypothetical protein
VHEFDYDNFKKLIIGFYSNGFYPNSESVQGSDLIGNLSEIWPYYKGYSPEKMYELINISISFGEKYPENKSIFLKKMFFHENLELLYYIMGSNSFSISSADLEDIPFYDSSESGDMFRFVTFTNISYLDENILTNNIGATSNIKNKIIRSLSKIPIDCGCNNEERAERTYNDICLKIVENIKEFVSKKEVWTEQEKYIFLKNIKNINSMVKFDIQKDIIGL